MVIGTWCSLLGGGKLPTREGADGTNALEGGVLGLGTVVQSTKRSTCTVCVLCVLLCCISTTTSDLKFVIRYGPNQSWVSLRFCWRSNGFGQYNQTSWPFVNEIALTRASKYDFWVFDDLFVALRTRPWAVRILSRKWILYGIKFNEQGRRTSLPNIIRCYPGRAMGSHPISCRDSRQFTRPVSRIVICSRP